MEVGGSRIGLVLSAGGIRGAAHLGVLRRLEDSRVPVRVLVGVSAGAVIAAFYAGVGFSVGQLIEEARIFRGRHLLIHGLRVRFPRLLGSLLLRFCGSIPPRLEQLDRCPFESLHHGVERLGIVCHDRQTGTPVYFSSARECDRPFAELVRASASVPFVIPPREIERCGRRYRLCDGGVGDSLPVAFARSPLMGATHLIVSDCRSFPAPLAESDRLVYLRPRFRSVGLFRSTRGARMKAVAAGEAAVTDEVLERVRSWR